jgi:hypothetical protein
MSEIAQEMTHEELAEWNRLMQEVFVAPKPRLLKVGSKAFQAYLKIRAENKPG